MSNKIFFKVEESFFDNWIITTNSQMNLPNEISYTYKQRHATNQSEIKVVGSIKTSPYACDAECEQLIRDEMFNLYGSYDLLTRDSLEAEGWFVSEI